MLGPTAILIKNDLPDFPDEVVQTWLLPLAKSAGWPPTPLSRWDHILMHRPLSFWRSVEWEKRRVSLNQFSLEHESLRRIQGLLDANVRGVYNIYAQQISNTGQRFRRIVRYLQQHGSLPAPPVLLSGGFQYEVLDGNHRLAAYFCVGASLLGPTCWVGQPRSPASNMR